MVGEAECGKLRGQERRNLESGKGKMGLGSGRMTHPVPLAPLLLGGRLDIAVRCLSLCGIVSGRAGVRGLCGIVAVGGMGTRAWAVRVWA